MLFVLNTVFTGLNSGMGSQDVLRELYSVEAFPANNRRKIAFIFIQQISKGTFRFNQIIVIRCK